MAQQPNYTLQTLDIPAGEYVEITRAGTFVTCLSATAAFKIAFDSGAESDFEEGLTLETGAGFTKVRLKNNGAATVRVRLAIGVGSIRDNRLIPAVPLEFKQVAPDEFDAPAPVAVPAGGSALLAAADTARFELAVSNPIGNTDPIYVGGAAVAVGSGFPVEPGGAVILTTTGAVYAACAVAVNVPIFETKRGAA